MIPPDTPIGTVAYFENAGGLQKCAISGPWESLDGVQKFPVSFDNPNHKARIPASALYLECDKAEECRTCRRGRCVGSPVYECRKNTPASCPNGGFAIWPLVREHDWCAEYKRGAFGPNPH